MTDINKDYGDGETILSIACRHNNIRMVEYLISKKANPNTILNEAMTPLLFAIDYFNLDMVNILLNGGADPNLYIKHGVCKNALEYAKRHGDDLTFAKKVATDNIIKALKKHGAKMPRGKHEA